MSLYQAIILDHYHHPRNFGQINKPTNIVSVSNRLCGDKIEMFAKFKKQKLKEIKFRAEGCAISIASASMLTSNIKNKSKDDLQKLDKDFMIKMLGIEIGPNRIKCALLPLEALHRLIS